MNFHDILAKHDGHKVLIVKYHLPDMVSLICNDCGYYGILSFDKEGKEMLNVNSAKERMKLICEQIPELLWTIKSNMTMFSHYDIEKQQYIDKINKILISLFPYVGGE